MTLPLANNTRTLSISETPLTSQWDEHLEDPEVLEDQEGLEDQEDWEDLEILLEDQMP